ncbi:hypothetical protein GA0115252_16202 [Streptomyces sp. DfronAA-171]|nr:hypothetical protein GA0115252_16202 [Streptomyces sp. DfronAA-171]
MTGRPTTSTVPLRARTRWKTATECVSTRPRSSRPISSGAGPLPASARRAPYVATTRQLCARCPETRRLASSVSVSWSAGVAKPGTTCPTSSLNWSTTPSWLRCRSPFRASRKVSAPVPSALTTATSAKASTMRPRSPPNEGSRGRRETAASCSAVAPLSAVVSWSATASASVVASLSPVASWSAGAAAGEVVGGACVRVGQGARSRWARGGPALLIPYSPRGSGSRSPGPSRRGPPPRRACCAGASRRRPPGGCRRGSCAPRPPPGVAGG